MKVSLCIAAVFLVALAPRGGQLAFKPVQGSSVHKSFVERTTWSLEPTATTSKGTDGWPATQLSGATERALTIVDRFDAVTRDGITRRSRAFEVARAKSSVVVTDSVPRKHELELVRTTRLEAARVVFERDAKSHELGLKYSTEAGRDPKLLTGLREDTDLLALLPSETVQPGASWTVDAARLVDVLRPAGDIALLPSDKTPSDDLLDPAQKFALSLLTLADNLDGLTGAARLTWERTEKDDERELAVISLKLEAVSRTSHGEHVARMLDAAARTSKRAQYDAVFAWSVKGTGELLWDLTNSRAASLLLDLESDIGVHETWHEQVRGEDKLAGDDFTLKATTELSAQFEVR